MSMINNDERAEIVTKGQADGARLYRVAESIYRGLIILNWIIGVGGAIFSAFALLSAIKTGGVGVAVCLGTALVTVVVCYFNYAVAVMATHVAKVMVHILFANLAVLAKDNTL